jgi:hypothetical protein
MEALEQVVVRIAERRPNELGIKVLENEPEVVLVSGSSLGVGTSTFIKEAFYNPTVQFSVCKVHHHMSWNLRGQCWSLQSTVVGIFGLAQ